MFAKLAPFMAIGAVLLFCSESQAQLPDTGPCSNYQGVTLSGQCVPNARKLGEKFVGRSLPTVGANGVAADLWITPTSNFSRIDRLKDGQVRIPPKYAFIVWGRGLGNTGHVAMVLGVVDSTKKTVRVVETNWDSKGSGGIRDVNLNDNRILGYMVWK